MEFIPFGVPKIDSFSMILESTWDHHQKRPTLIIHCHGAAKSWFGRPGKNPKKEKKTILDLLGKTSKKGPPRTSQKAIFDLEKPTLEGLGDALGRPWGTPWGDPPGNCFLNGKPQPSGPASEVP